MTDSQNIHRRSRWLQACVLLGAMLVLPMGLASAADYEAVERKLGEAVAEGILSLEEANVMLNTLRKSNHGKHAYKKEPHKQDYNDNLDATWEKLKAMVKAGQITEKQAHEKMAAIKKGAAAKSAYNKYGKGGGDERVKKYKQVEGKIKQAVEAGELSREDAIKKLEYLKKEIFSAKESGKRSAKQSGKKNQDPRVARYNAVAKEIHAAIKAGNISEEDGKKKLIELKKQIFDKP